MEPYILPTEIGFHCVALQIRELNVPCNPSYSFVTFLSKPTVVRDWNIQGLPSDAFSTENGVVVTKSSRYEILAVPLAYSTVYTSGHTCHLALSEYPRVNLEHESTLRCRRCYSTSQLIHRLTKISIFT